jgi:CubicO group peptidase (beta-lactamase class C family)
MTVPHRLLALAPLACLALASASWPSAARPEARLRDTLGDPAWPDDFWKPSTPEAEGLDRARLEAAVKALERLGEIHSFLVIRHGKLVLERYGAEYGNELVPESVVKPAGEVFALGPYDARQLFSITKSFTATLVGIAIAEKKIPSVKARVLPYFAKDAIGNPGPDKERITIEDLLTMRSGLDRADDRFSPMLLLRDPAGGAVPVLSSPMTAAPGARFAYSTAGSQVLAEIVRRATGEGLRAYAEKRLFGPLGIRDLHWSTDSKGTEMGGFGLSLRPRDVARFGYLFLSKGRWKGEQLVPEAWVAEATRVHVPGAKSNASYGYQCWIPSFGGFSAQGYLGQYMYVLPDKDLIVVFTANLPEFDEQLDSLMKEHILPAVR